MITIGVDQSLSKSALYEYKYLKNTKSLYKSDVNCDHQQNYKYIIEGNMVSTPEGPTKNKFNVNDKIRTCKES